MARIASLSILATTTGKDYLSEQYGKVIDNISTKNISSKIKNTDLSGNPDSGTVEAKRFVNAEIEEYGTARAAGAGAKIKAKPITVALDKNKEIIEEIEEKDIALYGVDGVIERRLKNHELRMGKDLERAFFTEMATAGAVFVPTATGIKERVEETIVTLEETENDFVDGVDRMFMTVIARPSVYSALQSEIDLLSNASTDSAASEVGVYHGCKIEKSIDLPKDIDFVVQVDGSVAQPLRYALQPAEKIGLSKAYGFGIYYEYGTKAVSEDLILVVKKEELGE